MAKEIKMPEMTYVQIAEPFGKQVREMIQKAYAEGYKQGKSDAVEVRPEIGDKLKQAERDRIVEQAKKDVEGLKYKDTDFHVTIGGFACVADFIVNKEKSTVVTLLRGYSSNVVRAKGIAKCAPGDCFNVWIGKAIALRRALGLEVPAEYLNVPNPTEVRVGDVMKVSVDDGTVEVKSVISTEGYGRLNVHLPGRSIQFPADYAEIIDDSREERSDGINRSNARASRRKR